MRYIIFLFLLSIQVGSGAFAQNWQQFGSITPGPLGNFYLDTIRNNLYAIGYFNNNIGQVVCSPAKWIGTDWECVGDFDFSNCGVPSSLLNYHDTIYLAGTFTFACNAPGSYLLKLNAGHWDTLNTSLNSYVNSLYEFNDELHIGGAFTTSDNVFSSKISKYNSNTGVWSAFPSILQFGDVRCMVEYYGRLYVGGSFDASNLTPYYYGHIISWDGTSFLPVDSGLALISSTTPFIYTLTKFQDKIIMSGEFSSANSRHIARNIIAWDYNGFSDLGIGLDGYVVKTQVYNNELYVVGSFNHAGGLIADNIAKWNGTEWCSLGSHFNGAIWDICVYNNELIVSGNFTQIDGLPIQHIAKWTGGSYSDSCLSINSVDLLDKGYGFYIYPNPTTEAIQINSYSNTQEIESVKIIDITGKQVYNETYNHLKNIEINMIGLSEGLYTIFIKGNNNQLNMEKMIILKK